MESTPDGGRRASVPLQRATRKAVRSLRMSCIAKAALLALIDYVNCDQYDESGKAEAWPSRDTLATEVGCSIRAIFNALQELQEARLISIQHRISDRGEYRSNVYAIHFDAIVEMARRWDRDRGHNVHNPHAFAALPVGTSCITPVHDVPDPYAPHAQEQVKEQITEPDKEQSDPNRGRNGDESECGALPLVKPSDSEADPGAAIVESPVRRHDVPMDALEKIASCKNGCGRPARLLWSGTCIECADGTTSQKNRQKEAVQKSLSFEEREAQRLARAARFRKHQMGGNASTTTGL